MPSFRGFLILICVCLGFAATGCQSTPATSCAGFSKNNLSPAGTVALIKADRGAFERVAGNDRNGQRQGCWE
ncbi:hypothetical protein GCM10010836_05870 [Aminobacter aminovorans]